jgi:hypothetical protein
VAISWREKLVFVASLKKKDNYEHVPLSLCINTPEITRGRSVLSCLVLFMGGEDGGDFVGGGNADGRHSTPARVARGSSALRYISSSSLFSFSRPLLVLFSAFLRHGHGCRQANLAHLWMIFYAKLVDNFVLVLRDRFGKGFDRYGWCSGLVTMKIDRKSYNFCR